MIPGLCGVVPSSHIASWAVACSDQRWCRIKLVITLCLSPGCFTGTVTVYEELINTGYLCNKFVAGVFNAIYSYDTYIGV